MKLKSERARKGSHWTPPNSFEFLSWKSLLSDIRSIMLASMLVFGHAAMAAPLTATFTPLGLANGSSFAAGFGVNNSGAVVGYTYIRSVPQATMWTGPAPFMMSTLGGSSSYAYGINNLGQVAGASDLPLNLDSRAVSWDVAGTPNALDGARGQAIAINDTGQAVGSHTVGGKSQAALWNGAALVPLTSDAPGRSHAYSINNSGQAVGFAAYNGQYNDVIRALLWNGTSATALSTPSSASSYAFGINNAGHIVGGLDFGTSSVGALWHGENVYELPVLAGAIESIGFRTYARDINDAGMIVGTTRMLDGQHATLWIDGEVVDLNSLLDAQSLAAGWKLRFATAISDSGYITGQASNASGQTYAYLMSVSVVPEPATLLLVGSVLPLLGATGLRRRRIR